MNKVLAAIAAVLILAACSSPAPDGNRIAAQAAAAGAADVKVTAGPGGGAILDGTLDGRQFALAIPHGWKGETLLMAHGYSIPGSPVAVPANPLSPDQTAGLLPRAYAEGLAVGHSAYDKAGMGVQTGATNTLRLKRFLDRFGARHVYVAGASMGGNIVLELIEDHPHEFAGALAVCGVDAGWEEEIGWLINLRAVYNYLTQDTPYALPGHHELATNGLEPVAPVGFLGGPWRTLQMWRTARPIVALFKAARAHPNGKEAALIKQIADLGETHPEPASFIVPLITVTLGMDDMNQTFGGIVGGNDGRVYSSDLLSPAQNAALNRGIQRIAADPKAVAYVDAWHRSRGDFTMPVVTLHNQIDSLVPYRQAVRFGETVAEMGHSASLIQFTAPPKVSPLTGTGLSGYEHCGFTTAQTQRAWDALHGWVANGVRPADTALPSSDAALVRDAGLAGDLASHQFAASSAAPAYLLTAARASTAAGFTATAATRRLPSTIGPSHLRFRPRSMTCSASTVMARPAAVRPRRE